MFLNIHGQSIEFNTGDIILFKEHPYNGLLACIDCAIRCFTKSEYSHVGLILVNPPWTAVPGVFVWDSSKHIYKDAEDGKIKYGIATIPIMDYIDYPGSRQELIIRRPVNKNVYARFSDKEKMTKIHDMVYGIHYDTTVGHWLAGMFHILIPRTEKTFFCSAFVSRVLTYFDILDAETDWTIVSPAELSDKSDKLLWKEKYSTDILFSQSK